MAQIGPSDKEYVGIYSLCSNSRLEEVVSLRIIEAESLLIIFNKISDGLKPSTTKIIDTYCADDSQTQY